MLIVSDIFKSLQGEGPDSGLITTFIRLHGCPFSCSYCDEIPKKKERMALERALRAIEEMGVNRICITGGEPLVQDETFVLIYELVGLGYSVSVETSGLVTLEDDRNQRSYSYIMDVKTPSSNMSQYNKLENFAILHPNDSVKYVIGNRVDYDYAKKIFLSYPTRATSWVSPIFNERGPVLKKNLAKWMLEDNLNWRMGVQLHKVMTFA